MACGSDVAVRCATFWGMERAGNEGIIGRLFGLLASGSSCVRLFESLTVRGARPWRGVLTNGIALQCNDLRSQADVAQLVRAPACGARLPTVSDASAGIYSRFSASEAGCGLKSESVRTPFSRQTETKVTPGVTPVAKRGACTGNTGGLRQPTGDATANRVCGLGAQAG